MRKILTGILAANLFCASFAYAGLIEGLEQKARKLTSSNKYQTNGKLDSKTMIAGLKEALSVGIKNGVQNVSRRDGYFENALIKILVPEKIQKITEVLRKAGLHEEVDAFELSMNRAAEKAAPKARGIIVAAIKKMTIRDAETILRGHDTAATEYLKSKTFDSIYSAFKPVITSTMHETDVTRSFKELMDKARAIPLLKEQTVDLDHYVTSKALDGLFIMVGEEEKKIRKDPAARVTKLLKKVFE
ncbi:MAG: DUF4197 domain-containing protein [Nitrospirota bacterium]